MTDKASARETYQAYLRGEITPEQLDQRTTDWWESLRGASPPQKPPKKD